jgi:aerotaxis receptor
MKRNLPVTDNEVTFDTPLISTTNLKGIISGFNNAFVNVSGFEPDELMNVNHNVIRHPDMPPAAFEDLWDTVKSKKHWMGIVKNRTKKGDFYWVDAYVTPIFDGDNVIGYESVRTKPSPEQVKRASELYQRINEGKTPKTPISDLSIKTKSTLASIFSSVLAIVAFSLVPQAGLGLFACVGRYCDWRAFLLFFPFMGVCFIKQGAGGSPGRNQQPSDVQNLHGQQR